MVPTREPVVKALFAQHGFLPEPDPAREFVTYPELAVLDELGRDLPSRLQDRGFRKYIQELRIPSWREASVS